MAKFDFNNLPQGSVIKTIFDPAAIQERLRINPLDVILEPPSVLEIIDDSGKNIPSFTRGNFSLLSDSAAYFNPYAETYRRLFVPTPRQMGKVAHDSNDSHGLIHKIISLGMDITGDYKNWYQVGASIASEHGEAGRNLFHQLSQLSPKYDQSDCERQYNNCLKNHGRYTIATLFYYAKQNGISV